MMVVASTGRSARNRTRVDSTYIKTAPSSSGNRKMKSSSSGSRKMNDKDLILILHEHFLKIGKSNVGGFRWMDKNNDDEISCDEIVQTLKDAGVSISNKRAKELIYSYVTPEGVMDVPGYIRFMASAYTYKDESE